MGTATQTPLFFTPKPVFGLDIGSGSLKVVQLDLNGSSKSAPNLVGYGTTSFDPAAINQGIIEQPEIIAKAARELFKKELVGDITSRRVAIAMPAYRTFTRSIQLPALKQSERKDAVILEAEQYLPMPLNDMHLDYTTISETKDGTEVLAVAVPQKIVSSYLDLCAILNLEPVLLETTMNSLGRLFEHDQHSDVTSVIIDLGSLSSDISIYDRSIVTTGTVEGGGEDFTRAIQEALNVTDSEVRIIKTKYGLGKSKRQAEIQAAVNPTLQKIVKEVKRLIRYHAERYSSDRPIKQVIAMGGGANLPGLSDYFTNELRLAVRTCDPWQYINYKGMATPDAADRPMYATAIGLACTDPREALK